MQKTRYKYRLELNRWTWIAGFSLLVFLGIILVQIFRNPPTFITSTTYEQPTVPFGGTYDPTNGTVAIHDGIVFYELFYTIAPNDITDVGSETSYEAGGYIPFWMLDDSYTTDTETLERPYDDVHYRMEGERDLGIPVMPPTSAEAAGTPKTSIERILELISQILDKLVQLTTATITIIGIWKSIKREEQKEEPKNEPETEK